MAGFKGDLLRFLYQLDIGVQYPKDNLCDKPKCRQVATRIVHAWERHNRDPSVASFSLGVSVHTCEADLPWGRRYLQDKADKKGVKLNQLEADTIE